ncbi:MAG TPA: hypothetical protein VGH70_12950 [Bradyrhizobium sp.]
MSKRELLPVEVNEDVAGDQISGDDEKDVDADEPALERGHLQVKQHDADNGNRAQAGNFRAKAAVHALSSNNRPSVSSRCRQSGGTDLPDFEKPPSGDDSAALPE